MRNAMVKVVVTDEIGDRVVVRVDGALLEPPVFIIPKHLLIEDRWHGIDPSVAGYQPKGGNDVSSNPEPPHVGSAAVKPQSKEK
jgi:hypothetical protein